MVIGMKQWKPFLIGAIIGAIIIFAIKTPNRFTIEHNAYLFIKLDRWTGKSWRSIGEQDWTPILTKEAPKRMPEAKLDFSSGGTPVKETVPDWASTVQETKASDTFSFEEAQMPAKRKPDPLGIESNGNSYLNKTNLPDFDGQ